MDCLLGLNYQRKVENEDRARQQVSAEGLIESRTTAAAAGGTAQLAAHTCMRAMAWQQTGQRNATANK